MAKESRLNTMCRFAMDFGVSESFRSSNRRFYYGDHGPAGVTSDGLT